MGRMIEWLEICSSGQVESERCKEGVFLVFPVEGLKVIITTCYTHCALLKIIFSSLDFAQIILIHAAKQRLLNTLIVTATLSLCLCVHVGVCAFVWSSLQAGLSSISVRMKP